MCPSNAPRLFLVPRVTRLHHSIRRTGLLLTRLSLTMPCSASSFRFFTGILRGVGLLVRCAITRGSGRMPSLRTLFLLVLARVLLRRSVADAAARTGGFRSARFGRLGVRRCRSAGGGRRRRRARGHRRVGVLGINEGRGDASDKKRCNAGKDHGHGGLRLLVLSPLLAEPRAFGIAVFHGHRPFLTLRCAHGETFCDATLFRPADTSHRRRTAPWRAHGALPNG